MKNLDEILAKAFAGDHDSVEIIRLAILNKTLTEAEKKMLLKATEGNISNKSYMLYLRGLAFVNFEIEGFTLEQRLEIAIHLYDQAIRFNNPFAMNNRAAMHHHGQGCPVNYAEAARLYDKASSLGLNHPGAISNRATMHLYGHGGPEDHTKAIFLYNLATLLNSPYAMNGRAKMFYDGKGGPKNYAEAARLYRKSIKHAKKNNYTLILEQALNNFQELYSNTTTNHPEYFEVIYHWTMLSWEKEKIIPQTMHTNPVKFLTMLANDIDLSKKKRLALALPWIDKYISAITSIEKNLTLQALNLLGEYWKNKAQQYLYSNHYLAVVWALQNIPKKSELYAEACYGIAMHNCFEMINTKQLDYSTALEYAKPYIQAGMILNDAASIQFNDLVYLPNTLSDQIKAVIKILPLAVQQVLASHKAEQDLIENNLSNTRKFFSSLTDFFSSKEKLTLIIQQQAIKIMQDGLANFKETSENDLLEFAMQFSSKIQKLITNFPPSKTKTTQSLVYLSNQLENIIFELMNKTSLQKNITSLKGISN